MGRRPSPAVLAAAAILLAALFGGTTPPTRAATCGADSTTLLDGGFETPMVAPDTYVQLDASLVAPWLTTDSLDEIELWGTGFLGVPSDEGSQFAELNANSPGTLYQDVATTSGEDMTWTLAHRGREGDDTMEVLIGNAATADVLSDAGWNYTSPALTDGTDAWGTHTAEYIVPDGQTCTRFAFRAVSSAGGDPSIGNFLDAVGFSVTIPPTPTPSPSPSSSPSGGALPTATAVATSRPTPPATDTVAADHQSDLGPSWLVLLVLGLGGLGVSLGRRSRDSKRAAHRGPGRRN